MIVDTHTHLYHARFDSDRDAVIDRARNSGVEVMIMPAIDVASIDAALALCAKHPGLYAMAAIHPSDVKDATDEDFRSVERLAMEEGIVAIGESGLDYYWDRSFDEKQHEYFRRHIRLAMERDLPLVIHNRDATEDVLRLLEEERTRANDPQRLRGILHCFGGPADVIARAIDLGFSFGIGGTVTFKNSGVSEVVQKIPLDRILVETDAPFLAPVPHRGKRNEPAYTRYVVERIAQIKEMSIEAVEEVTTANAAQLFRLVP